MKRIALVTILFLSSYFGYGHDLRMAVFEINRVENGLSLSVNFDRDALLRSVLTANQEFETLTEPQLNELIVWYINHNLGLSINGNCVEIEFDSIHHDNENISLQGLMIGQYGNVEYIEVFNTCLIDYNKKHLNIMKSTLHNRVRTFRLSEDRIVTTIDYRS